MMKFKLLSFSLLCVLVGMIPYMLGTVSISGGSGSNSTGTAQLRTATGSASGASGACITMNDYSFAPSFTNTLNQQTLLTCGPLVDPGNTISQVFVSATGGTSNVRWRYITASDTPRVWVASDPITGVINFVWSSDDPCTKDDTTPCLIVLGNIVSRFDPAKLDQIPYTGKELSDAAKKNSKPVNLNYRALQMRTGQETPAKWIFENMKIRISDGALVCQTVC